MGVAGVPCRVLSTLAARGFGLCQREAWEGVPRRAQRTRRCRPPASAHPRQQLGVQGLRHLLAPTVQGSEVVTERVRGSVFVHVCHNVRDCVSARANERQCLRGRERKHPRCMAMRAGIGRYVLVWVCVGRSVPFCLSCPKG